MASKRRKKKKKPDTPALPPRVRWGNLLLASLGGVMQCLGFAGWSWWPFALICWLPMFWILETEPNMTGKRAFRLGLAHGFVGYTGGYYWLVDMLENFSGYEGIPNWFFGSVFFLYHGCQQAFIYALYHRIHRRGWPRMLAAIAALLTLEIAFPVLFPAFLSTGFHNVPIFIQTADFAGPMFASAVVMSINVALYEMWKWRKTRILPKRDLMIAIGSLVFSLGYGAYRMANIDARAEAAPTLEVGTVQVNMGIFEKREEPFEGHRRHLRQSQLLERNHPDLDLLVWPESAYTFFLPESMTNVKERVLGPVSTPTLFGGLTRRQGESRMEAFNTAFLTDADGEIVGTYDKTYLLMFGEYLPFGDTFPVLYEYSPNSGRFTPGDHVRPLVLPHPEHGDVRMSTLVCYEDVLPRFTRSAVREGNPHLLVNITNDSWFGDTQEPWIHLALAKFRAIEHHRALVRSTNSGVSAFVDPVGRVIDTIGVEEQGQSTAELPLLDGWTPYQTLGDWPGWAGLGLAFWFGFVGRRKEDESAPADA